MIRVLVCDDDHDLSELLSRNFAEYARDWQIVQCATFQSLLDATKEPCNLIILDLCLPDSPISNTTDVIGLLIHSAPVIALTGMVDEDTHLALRCFANGAGDYWHKSELHGPGMAYFLRSCRATIRRNQSRKNAQR